MASITEVLGRGPVHPFPARMAPDVALDALRRGRRSMRVLDPMSGSGTVLAVARAQGHRAVGIDCDPLSVLSARVWTRTVVPHRAMATARRVLARARKLCDATPATTAYPAHSDPETKRFICYWFDPLARRQLYGLALSISRTRDASVRDALWIAFSRTIITKQAGASRAMDLSHSRPHRTFTKAPRLPFDCFISACERVVSNAPSRSAETVGPRTQVSLGDARRLSFRSASFDAVVSSPPYLNAIDYMRCSRFSLVWMGFTMSELRRIRTESVGSEVSTGRSLGNARLRRAFRALGDLRDLPSRQRGMLVRYVNDLDRITAEISRVLRRSGKAVLVIGDSCVRGTFVRNSSALRSLAKCHSLALVEWTTRTIPPNRRYLPPPSATASGDQLRSRMRREVVLALEKQ